MVGSWKTWDMNRSLTHASLILYPSTLLGLKTEDLTTDKHEGCAIFKQTVFQSATGQFC